jgi:hypothetical protein
MPSSAEARLFEGGAAVAKSRISLVAEEDAGASNGLTSSDGGGSESTQSADELQRENKAWIQCFK